MYTCGAVRYGNPTRVRPADEQRKVADVGTPSSSILNLINIMTGKGGDFTEPDADAFAAIAAKALHNVAFMFRDVSTPTLADNGRTKTSLHDSAKMGSYRSLRAFYLHSVFGDDAMETMFFIADPMHVMKVIAMPNDNRQPKTLLSCDEIELTKMFEIMVQAGDGDPVWTLLNAIEHLQFGILNRMKNTRSKVEEKREKNHALMAVYRAAHPANPS